MSSAAVTDGGDALYESSMSITRPRRMTWPRCAADQPPASAWTIRAGSMPAAWPTAAPASALWTESLPSPGIRAGEADGPAAARGRQPEREAHPVEAVRGDVVGA